MGTRKDCEATTTWGAVVHKGHNTTVEWLAIHVCSVGDRLTYRVRMWWGRAGQVADHATDALRLLPCAAVYAPRCTKCGLDELALA